MLTSSSSIFSPSTLVLLGPFSSIFVSSVAVICLSLYGHVPSVFPVLTTLFFHRAISQVNLSICLPSRLFVPFILSDASHDSDDSDDDDDGHDYCWRDLFTQIDCKEGQNLRLLLLQPKPWGGIYRRTGGEKWKTGSRGAWPMGGLETKNNTGSHIKSYKWEKTKIVHSIVHRLNKKHINGNWTTTK